MHMNIVSFPCFFFGIIWTQWDSVSLYIIWRYWLSCFSFTSITNLSSLIETWNVAFTSSFYFLHLYSIFLVAFLCSCVYFWVHIGMCITGWLSKRGFWMLLKLRTWIWKKRVGSMTLMWLLSHGKSNLAPI